MDYRLSRERTDSFVDALNEALIGWNTCFTVSNTDDETVFNIRVRDSLWNRELTFRLNIRYWTISALNCNDKIDFSELLRINKSIGIVIDELRAKYSEEKNGN